MNDHDFQRVGNQRILHTTLKRDWVCGICEGKLITLPELDEETRTCTWRTVCSQDATHDPNAFIHTWAAARRASQRLMEHLEAREVFRHLPEELQDAILRKEKECQSVA